MTKIMKIACIVAVVALITVCFVSSCSGGVNHIEKDIAYGPFTIRATATKSKQFNINYGMVNQTDVAYTILYNGKPVVFPDALQRNTGLPYLWRVYALPGAPDPTLIAGSQSLYLIYLKNGAPVVESILEQHHDFASLQFLDSENGQPGPYQEVFARSNTDDLDKLDSLTNGRFLLVSGHAVLDVQTRSIRRFNSNNNDVENYSFPSPRGALAFSPDRKSIVFRGAFQSWNTADEDLPDSEHALVVYDIEQDSGYAVKFDDTELRLINVNDMDFAWFEKFFEWEKSAQGDRLRLRKLEKAPYWTGRFKVEYASPYYTLYPVKASMLPAFLAFLEQQTGWTKANLVEDKFHEYTGRILTFADGELKFDVTMKEDAQILQFSKHIYADANPEYTALVKKIADAFEAALASGKYQEHFGRIESETKQIRGAGSPKE
ncbi:MAG: hypothetical protein A4S08_02655 [Proteobacteria bacterium SG_bin4]|nr:MAG: hypothetical protein A4S08_02655 [Proteobacteria bacterium SG_bin4]